MRTQLVEIAAQLSRLAQLRHSRLELREGGRTHVFGPAGASGVTVEVHDRRAYAAIALGGAVGAGEAYARGWWGTSDLTAVVRLVRRGTARYPNRRVHADMITRGPAPVLRNPMTHYMTDSFDEYARRIEKYSFWGAAQNWREGRKAGFTQIFGRSVWRFLRTYIFQLGVLDGMHGLVFCMLQAYGTYLKWALLWGWHVNAARGVMPNLPAFDESETTWRPLAGIAPVTM